MTAPGHALQRKPKHLLVDLDGTLLEHRDLPLRLAFISKALSELRRHGGWLRAMRALHEVRRAIERPAPAGVDPLTLPTNAARAEAAFLRTFALSAGRSSPSLHDALACVFPTLSPHFFPVPGAREFLDWAKPRFAMTLATNPVWPEAFVRMRLGWAGVDPSEFSGGITHAGSMHSCKPSLAYFREVLSTRGLEGTDCLLIGDDHRKDLPALEAGVAVFILEPPGRRSPLRSLDPRGGWQGSYSDLRDLLEGSSR